MITTLLTAAMITTTFNAYYSPKIAEQIVQDVIYEEFNPDYDYDGDGAETLLDAIGVLKHYYSNLEKGNIITFSSADFNAIAESNNIQAIYYEIDFIGRLPCREYEFTADKVERIHVYYETEDECGGFWLEIDPFKELISIEEEA